MTIPGLLIEYLITGAFGLVWIFSLAACLSMGAASYADVGAAEVTFLVPLAYILGTFIDHLGRAATRVIDKSLGKRGKHGSDEYHVVIEFCSDPPIIRKERIRVVGKEEMFVRSPEAAKQYELRKTRDRVARGVFANFVIMLFVIPSVIAFKSPSHLAYAVPVLLGFTWISYRVWAKTVELSIKFRNDISVEFFRQDEESRKRSSYSTRSATRMVETRTPLHVLAVLSASLIAGATLRRILRK